MVYSIDASESNGKLSESKININGVSTKVTTQHRRMGSRDDTEFGLGGQGGNGRHVRCTSRGEELSVSHIETRNSDHAHVGRQGSAPGTPSRNQVCIYVERDSHISNPQYYQIISNPQLYIHFPNLSLFLCHRITCICIIMITISK